MARRKRGRAIGEGVRRPRNLHEATGGGSLPLPAARACLGLRVREPLEHSRLLCPLPAREDRPPVRGRVDRDGAWSRIPAAERRRALSRLPIRLRVTLAFTAAMAVVLIAVGLFLYLRLEAQLDSSINNGLRSRAGEVGAFARTSKTGLGSHGTSLIEQDESFAQVLSRDGRILDSTPQLKDR